MEELGGRTEYNLGGGTVLAARWRHHMSFDTDILVAKTTAVEKQTTDGGTSPDPRSTREHRSERKASA